MSDNTKAGLRRFQSTLLMRGATEELEKAEKLLNISIHAPHARSDRHRRAKKRFPILFQSTLLMRGATVGDLNGVQVRQISIHAPHARSDGSP